MKLNYIITLPKMITMVIIFLSFVGYNSFADISGRTGRTSTTSSGCASCHSASPNGAVTVSCSSQNGLWTVQPNSTNTFTVTVSHASLTRAGVNIAVKTDQTGTTNAGTLAPETGSGLKLSSSELTHSSPKVLSGTCSFNFTWTAPSTPGTYYLRAIGIAVNNNGNNDANDLWNWMNVQAITVEAGSSISISSPIGSESWCPGTAHNINWSSNGVTNVKIDLSTDGGATFLTELVASTPAGAGTWAWSIPPNQASGTGHKVRISDAAVPTINSTSPSNFTIPAPASITTHPQSSSVCAGTQASFSVVTSGNVSSFKWQKNGIDLPASNSATYTISAAAVADTGSYTCVVTPLCGNQITSNSASLSVKALTSITSHPTSRAVCLDDSVTFSVGATGTNVTYQWRKNGTPITDARSSSYSISQVAAGDSGKYDVLVLGECGSAITSNQAILTVNKPPTITRQLQSVNACPGTKAILWIKATGTNLKYLWKKNGNEITGYDNDTLFFNNVSSADDASYEVTVSGTCSPDASSIAGLLIVTVKAEVTTEPKDITVNEGEAAEIGFNSKGSNLKFQWRKDGTILNGKTLAILQFASLKTTDAGSYDCIISNECGADTTKAAILKVNALSGPICSLQYDNFGIPQKFINSKIDTILKSVVKNTGSSDLIINGITISGSGSKNFNFINLPAFPLTVKKDETIDLALSFTVIDTGSIQAKIDFSTNAKSNPSLTINSFGAYSELKAQNSKISFIFTSDTIISVTKDMSITNYGNISADCALEFKGTDPNRFLIQLDQFSFTISPNATQTISIRCVIGSLDKASAFATTTNKTTGKYINVVLDAFKQYNSVFDLADGKISFLPNPVYDILQLDLPVSLSTNAIVEIYDFNGKNILIQNINSGKNKIDVENLKSGIYILNIISNGKTYSSKFIKSPR